MSCSIRDPSPRDFSIMTLWPTVLSRDVAVKFLLHIALAPWAPLSRIDNSLFTAVTKWSSSSKKTLLSQSVRLPNMLYWLPDIKVAQFSFEEDVNSKCHFQIISHVQWWTKKCHPFLHSTYQECKIFARIGDDPCYYHWNEIYAGVYVFLVIYYSWKT